MSSDDIGGLGTRRANQTIYSGLDLSAVRSRRTSSAVRSGKKDSGERMRAVDEQRLGDHFPLHCVLMSSISDVRRELVESGAEGISDLGMPDIRSAELR